MVAQVIATHGLSQRRACGLIEITRRSFRRPPRSDRNQELRQRLRALAEERRRWGCPMLYQVIRREGWRSLQDQQAPRKPEDFGVRRCTGASRGLQAAECCLSAINYLGNLA